MCFLKISCLIKISTTFPYFHLESRSTVGTLNAGKKKKKKEDTERNLTIFMSSDFKNNADLSCIKLRRASHSTALRHRPRMASNLKVKTVKS